MNKENKMDLRRVPGKKTRINIRTASTSSSHMMTSLANETRGASLSQESDTGTDFFVHPFKSKGRGWRSGQDITAGRTIRKDADGFEKLEDYLLCLSETDEESTRELSEPELENSNKRKSKNSKGASTMRNTRMNMRANSINSSGLTSSSLAIDNRESNRRQASVTDNIFVHPFKDTAKGWRSGRNFRANKVIRKVDGFEEIEDYFTESDADSISVSKLSDASIRVSLGKVYSETCGSSAKPDNPQLSEGRVTRQQKKDRMSKEMCNRDASASEIKESNVDVEKTEAFHSQNSRLTERTSLETDGNSDTNEAPECFSTVSNLKQSQHGQKLHSDSDEYDPRSNEKSYLRATAKCQESSISDTDSDDPDCTGTSSEKSPSSENSHQGQNTDNCVQKLSKRTSTGKHNSTVTLGTSHLNDTFTTHTAATNSDESQSRQSYKKNMTSSDAYNTNSKASDLDSPEKGSDLDSPEKGSDLDSPEKGSEKLPEAQSEVGVVSDTGSSDERENTITPAENVTNLLNSDHEGLQSSQESSQASQEDVSGTVKKQPPRTSSQMLVLAPESDHSKGERGVDTAPDSEDSQRPDHDLETNELQSGYDDAEQTEKPLIRVSNENLLKETNVEIVIQKTPNVSPHQQETYDTPTGIIEKSGLLLPRVSVLRMSQVSIDAAGTLTGSITKSQIAKTSSEETPLTNVGTRKRLSYSVVLRDNPHDASTTSKTSNSTKTNKIADEEDKSLQNGAVASGQSNWLSSVLSSQQNNDTDEVEEDVDDFVVIDNTQTFTLDEILSSKQTHAKKKAKLKKSVHSESDNLSKRVSQKYGVKIDKSAKTKRKQKKIESPKSEDAQQNNDTEELEDVEEFVVIDNTQTFTLDEILSSKQTHAKKKGKPKKSTCSEADDLGKKVSQKSGVKIDKSTKAKKEQKKIESPKSEDVQQNNDTEELEDVEEFVIDNTQTFTLDEILSSKQTHAKKKGKLNKSASFESDDLSKKVSQKSGIKIDKSAKTKKIESLKYEDEQTEKTNRRKNSGNARKTREQKKIISSDSDDMQLQTKLQKSFEKKKKGKLRNRMLIPEETSESDAAQQKRITGTSTKTGDSHCKQQQKSDDTIEMTTTSMMSIDDGIFKSGISIRSRKRSASLSPIPKSPKDKILRKDKKKTERKETHHAMPTTSTPLMDSEEPSSIRLSGLTPCLVKPGAKKGKKERRVTINEASAILPIPVAAHGTSVPTPSISCSPEHFYEVTSSQTPVPFKKPGQCKIIYPEPAPDGLRRSQRTRVVGLEWYKNERIVYDRRKSGAQIMGIKPSNEAKYNEMEDERRKRRKMQIKKRKKMSHNETPRNMSVHAEMEDDLDITCTKEIAVFNPEDKEDVLIDCISSKDSQCFSGLSGNDPRSSDPYIVCKDLCHPCFRCGDIILRPLKEKPTEYVWDGVLIFFVLKGKVSVTIHQTTTILEPGDKFFIPSGNTYKIQNLRNENAKLSYTVIHMDRETNTDSRQDGDS